MNENSRRHLQDASEQRNSEENSKSLAEQFFPSSNHSRSSAWEYEGLTSSMAQGLNSRLKSDSEIRSPQGSSEVSLPVSTWDPNQLEGFSLFPINGSTLEQFSFCPSLQSNFQETEFPTASWEARLTADNEEHLCPSFNQSINDNATSSSSVIYPFNMLGQQFDLSSVQTDLRQERNFSFNSDFAPTIISTENYSGKLFEPTPSTSARPSLISDWNESHMPYTSTSNGYLPIESSQNLNLPSEPAVVNSLDFYSYGTELPTQCLDSQEEIKAEVYPVSLQTNSRQNTPGENEKARKSSSWTPPGSKNYHGDIDRTQFTHLSSSSSPGSLSQTTNSSTPSFSLSAQAARNRSFSYTPNFDSPLEYKQEGNESLLNFINRDVSRHSICTTVSAISIPSPPQLFASANLGNNALFGTSIVPHVSRLLAPITEDELNPGGKVKDSNSQKSNNKANETGTKDKQNRPKRKRMHICNICGKDFNRPSALLLHSSVHTGERSNFCNVCGRSFSNLSNLRRHQRQLHVLESQLPLPLLPKPQSYNHQSLGVQGPF
ncbi:hypothetical protein BY996DRAFT_6423390 [Phakopsora pachyrhizi]|nr:hypothetical protein BY996DRAFT_6424070 [Phakopsora pachyrhizi]KAI8445910.1 hypothetical protein BY996DRAFT_6423390 [Phakopsora pachyrhizi]